MPPWARPVPGGIELLLAVSPGASSSRLAGELGPRLKVRVAAPPEDGRANRAVEELLGAWLGVPVSITAGHASRRKTALAGGLRDLVPGALAGASSFRL